MLTFGALWFAALLLPAVVVSLFLRQAKHLFSAYVIVLIASLVVALVFFIISEATDSTKAMVLLVPVCPPLGILSFGEIKRVGVEAAMIIALTTCSAYWIVLLIRSLADWARIRAMDCHLDPKPPTASLPDTADVA